MRFAYRRRKGRHRQHPAADGVPGHADHPATQGPYLAIGLRIVVRSQRTSCRNGRKAPRQGPDRGSRHGVHRWQRYCEPTGRREAPPDDRLREAIQLLRNDRESWCFVASAFARKRASADKSAPRNDAVKFQFKFQTADTRRAGTASRSRGTIRPSVASIFLTLSIRGRGEAGRPMRPIAACAMIVVEGTRVSQVTPKSPGIPRAMVYGLYVISPAIGSFATVTCGTCRRLDTSTEMSGPHDFAVRVRRPRPERHPRPPHPRPAPVTLRDAPLDGTGCTGYRLICNF